MILSRAIRLILKNRKEYNKQMITLNHNQYMISLNKYDATLYYLIGMFKNMKNNLYSQYRRAENISYIPQKENNEISNSITKNWTDQAIRCYLSNSNCIDCSIAKGNYSFVCQMSSVINILLEQIGPPEKNKIEKLSA